MLVAQAKESAEWFTNAKIDNKVIEAIYRSLRVQMGNVILIGMPGCGKTTIGQLLSKRLGKKFLDADTVLEEKAGRPITQIIPQEGEAFFRRLESEVLEDLGKQSGLVIATGGGCVTIPANYEALHRNGTIVWLKRDLSALPSDGRPLSMAGRLDEMYAKRKPLYEGFADFAVENSGPPEETTDGIVKLIK